MSSNPSGRSWASASAEDARRAALAGIRIVDLTTVVFGPTATQTLADYGADVIKIEAPEGDSTRRTGPAAEPGMSSLFLGANRNKRSVVIDIKSDEGRRDLAAIIATADVFVHNMRPQKLERLGLSNAQLRHLHPRLVYVGLHGFGMDGPYSGLPAYDDIIQALSGAADLGARQGGAPRYMPSVIADKVAGQMAVHAVLAALFQRERTGEGQFVEVPMLECAVQFLLFEHLYARHIRPEGRETPPKPEEFGYIRSLAEWRRPYPTTDGYICFMPYNDQNWTDFFRALGRDDYLADPRFLNLTERTRNVEALLRILEGIIATQSTQHWLDLGARLGVPCAPINGLADLESDPHIAAVGLFDSMPSGANWDMRFVRSPVRLSSSSVPPRMPPRLGEHTAEVLTELNERTTEAASERAGLPR